jgi:transcriptional regulator with XRE-family HTH domain
MKDGITEIMTMETIKEKLQDRQLTKISKITGISYNTISDIAKGKNRKYSVCAIIALSDYLREH